jgi:hypothetical protein
MFESDGRLRYTGEGRTIQHILLTWRIDGNVLVTYQPSCTAGGKNTCSFGRAVAAPSRTAQRNLHL